MALPFDSNEFKAAVANCKRQFSTEELAETITKMIGYYDSLLAEAMKRVNGGKQPLPPHPKGEKLYYFKCIIDINALPKSITYADKQHPVPERVKSYFGEIERLEKPVQPK